MTTARNFARFKRDNTKYGKRHIPGQMNHTETAYADELQALMVTGQVLAWKFEAVTFKIADNTRYTPDFMVWYADGVMEFVDSKGGGPIDPKSIVKVKCAADQFPAFRFVIEQRRAKKDGGGWKRTEY